MIPPSEINNMDYDHLIISVPEYGKEVTKYLVEEYGVDAKKILVYDPSLWGFDWEEERIVMLRKCVAILKERNVQGNAAEVGVYRGDFARLINNYLPEKKLYLFDTFTGFDDRDEYEAVDAGRFKNTSVQYVLSRMPYPEQCVVRQGYFPETVGDLNDKFAFVSLDCDLYKPIRAGLEYFYPRLEKGGYIFVHDFGHLHYARVKQAVYEYCEKYNAAMVPIVDRGMTAIITK